MLVSGNAPPGVSATATYLLLLPMESANLPENLAVVSLSQVAVDQLADEEIQGCPLLLLNGRELGRVDVVDGILNQHLLGLANMLHRLLAL